MLRILFTVYDGLRTHRSTNKNLWKTLRNSVDITSDILRALLAQQSLYIVKLVNYKSLI